MMTKKQKKEVVHKPVIETIINTSALALTSTGVVLATSDKTVWGFCRGLILVAFGAALEWFKYFGRAKNLW